MDKTKAEQILREFARMHGDVSFLAKKKSIDFSSELFKQQRDMINDPSKMKAGLTSRRAGKSYSTVFYMIKEAYEKPRTHIAYVALSRRNAYDAMWDELVVVLARYGIGYTTDKNMLQFRLDNGSKITLSGATSESVLETHRGQHYSLVIIDEAASVRFLPILEGFIDNVIDPTLMDDDGTLLLISSPGIVCKGFFYDITTGALPAWSVHKWTLLDNLKLPRWRNKPNWKELAEQFMADTKIKKNWDDLSPTFIREYKGEWVDGTGNTIYPFTQSNNTFTELPDLEFNYIFGVDFGIVDASTLIVVAYSDDSDKLWVVDEYKRSDMAPSKFADVVAGFYDTYKPKLVVGDSGGMGKAFIKEIEQHFDLPLEAALKTGKLGMVELLADDFRRGNIMVHDRLVNLQAELYAYQWKDATLKLLPDYAEDHLLDALLYAYRRSMHYVKKEPIKPKASAVDEMFMARVESIKSNEDKPWWDID